MVKKRVVEGRTTEEREKKIASPFRPQIYQIQYSRTDASFLPEIVDCLVHSCDSCSMFEFLLHCLYSKNVQGKGTHQTLL